MIKIIKQGTPEEEYIWEGTCSNCKSTIECNKSDIKYENDGKGFDIAYVKCPRNKCVSNVYMTRTKRTSFTAITKTIDQFDRAYDQNDR